MTKPALTLALAHYDRTVPFFEGDVGVAGAELQVLEVGQTIPGRDGEHRHERMLRDAEFDAAEVSLSSYLIAKERKLPFTAIPVFPRRLDHAAVAGGEFIRSVHARYLKGEESCRK